MDRSRSWTLAAVLFAVLLVVVLKSSLGTRHQEAAAPPEHAGASAQEVSSAASDTSSSERAASAGAETSAPEATGSASAERSGPKGAGSPASSEGAASSKKLPKMLELGSVSCHACQQMQPIIEALKVELKGKVDVEFVDVMRHGDVADKYGIQVIPTQIFLDADGKELFRHVGFYPKEEIVAKMKELKMLP
ncbi:MAG: thioredoxin family protein [Armatimonadetes bacterium]|nr:thioredoxin family protein [Armatimonadota bacterium]